MKITIRFSVILFILSFIIITNTSCDVDPYSGKRPIDYPNTKWICEEIDMYFIVSNDSMLEKCEIIDKNGATVEATLLWSALDSSVLIKKSDDAETYFYASKCEFNDNKFVMHISDVKNSNFNHIPDNLTFYRFDT